LLLLLEHLVFLDDVLKDEFIDSVLQAGRDVFDEKNKLFLVLLRLLGVLQEAYHLGLDIWSQFNIVHRGIHLV